MEEILIKGGTVYDGSGCPGKRADVLIKGDRIAQIGKLEGAKAGVIIEAKGRAVSPGFVDVHTHSELPSLDTPMAESRAHAGVTTEVMGHCGGSAFPLRGLALEEKKLAAEGRAFSVDWTDVEGYFRKAEGVGYSVNRATLVGHGTVRAAVMGYAQRRPTTDEMGRMAGEVRHALEAGAFGLSSGLIYPPGCFAETEELIELCKVVAKAGGIYESHIRSESDALIEAVEEHLEITRRSGVRSQIAHLKAMRKQNWHKIDALEQTLTKAIEEEGLDVTADRYPYIASETGLSSVLPNWAHEGGTGRMVERLVTAETRERIKEELKASHGEEESWERILIGEVLTEANKGFEGKTMLEAARAMGMAPTEAALKLLVEEKGQVGCVFRGMKEENLRRILKWRFVTIGSDSSVSTPEISRRRGKPHPRTYGTTARVLGRYGRETGVLKTEEAVRKLSGQPAQRIGLAERGLLKKGYYADVVVFDPETVIDNATYEQPYQYSTGIETVIVNGVVTVRQGTHTGAKAGRMLRRGNA